MTQEKVENQQWFKDKLNEILAKYCYVYTGDMTVYKSSTIYTLALHLLDRESPLIMAGEFLTDESFMEYIAKEMQARKLFERVKYSKLNRVYE